MSRRKPRGRPLDGWLIIDKPAGADQHGRGQPRPPAVRRAEGRAWRHARPAGHRSAADRVRRRHQNRALRHGRHQAVSLHPPLRRGARHRRRRRRGDRDHRRPPRSTPRSRPRCLPSAATSCRSRRSSPPSRSPASAPTTWPAKAARRCWSRGPPASTGSSWSTAPTPTPRCSRSPPARASTCAASRATWPGPAAPLATSPPCAACGSVRSWRTRRFRWTNSREPEDTAPASPDLLLPVATALADIPALALTEQEAADLRHGQAISLVALMGRIPTAADPDGGLARAMAGGRVIGLCRLRGRAAEAERVL